MNLRMVTTGLIALMVAASAHATTLKLAPDIDLLVLDGRKISGSLLKGADGLELEQGQHQVLFRIEKSINRSHQKTQNWVSSPLIATFNSQAKSITISLPALVTLQDAKRFEQHPDFQLINELGAVVESRRDRLTPGSDSSYEQAMMSYNLKGNVASVPRFAQPQTSQSAGNIEASEFANDNHPGHRVLQLWYQQVDSATRQRFVMLMRALRTG